MIYSHQHRVSSSPHLQFNGQGQLFYGWRYNCRVKNKRADRELSALQFLPLVGWLSPARCVDFYQRRIRPPAKNGPSDYAVLPLIFSYAVATFAILNRKIFRRLYPMHISLNSPRTFSIVRKRKVL